MREKHTRWFNTDSNSTNSHVVHKTQENKGNSFICRYLLAEDSNDLISFINCNSTSCKEAITMLKLNKSPCLETLDLGSSVASDLILGEKYDKLQQINYRPAQLIKQCGRALE